MTFVWILGGIIVLLVFFVQVQWWRDEQDKMGTRSIKSDQVIPAASHRGVKLHPSIDPYLAELREYLLQDPLPQGPGEMAQRVYTHLNEWMTTHLTADAPYDTSSDLEDQLLVEPTQRFVNMSRNDPVPPPGYLEHIMDGVNRDQ